MIVEIEMKEELVSYCVLLSMVFMMDTWRQSPPGRNQPGRGEDPKSAVQHPVQLPCPIENGSSG